MNLNQRAALLVRSLMSDLGISGHIVFVRNGPNISSATVLEQLEGPHVGDTEGDGAGGEAALAIGEHAFRAGFAAAVEAWSKSTAPSSGWTDTVSGAWNAYDPPEDIKALS